MHTSVSSNNITSRMREILGLTNLTRWLGRNGFFSAWSKKCLFTEGLTKSHCGASALSCLIYYSSRTAWAWVFGLGLGHGHLFHVLCQNLCLKRRACVIENVFLVHSHKSLWAHTVVLCGCSWSSLTHSSAILGGISLLSVLVSFPNAMIKYFAKSKLGEKWLI